MPLAELSEHFGLRTPVTLLQSDRPALLVTWGLFAPKVMLPVDAASWDDDRIRVVLAHELAHVRRHDWIIQIGSELVRIANWFNPLVWLAASRLRLESERACDDAVVNLGVSGREYAEHLLDLARQFGRARHGPFPAVAIVPRPSNLERRVTAMLNARLSRRPVSRDRASCHARGAAGRRPADCAVCAKHVLHALRLGLDQSGAVLPVWPWSRPTATGGVDMKCRPMGPASSRSSACLRAATHCRPSLPGFETVEQELMFGGEDIRRDITLSDRNAPGDGFSVTGPADRARPFPSEWTIQSSPGQLRPSGTARSRPPPRTMARPRRWTDPSARQSCITWRPSIRTARTPGSRDQRRHRPRWIRQGNRGHSTTPRPSLAQSASRRRTSMGVRADAAQLRAVPVQMIVTVDFSLDLNSRERPRAHDQEQRRHDDQHYRVGGDADLRARR